MKAQEAFREKQYDQALELVTKCLASTIRDSLGKGMGLKPQLFYDAKFLEAEIYIIQKEFEKANDIFESIKQSLVGDLQDVAFLRAKNYYLKARIERARNNPLEFGDNMHQAKKQFINVNMYQDAIDILFDLIDFNKDRISSSNIYDLYTEIEDLSKRIKDKDNARLNSANAKLELVRVGGVPDDKQARDLLTDAINNFDKIKHYQLTSEAKLELANIEEKYDLEKSEKLIEEAMNYLPEDKLDAITNAKLASIKVMKGEGDAMMEKLSLLISDLNSEKKTVPLCKTVSNLCKSLVIHHTQSHTELVNDLVKLCISVNEELDQRYGKGISFLFEGLFLSLSGDSDGGKNKLNMLKILYKKLEKDISSLSSTSWQTQVISFIAHYEDTKDLGDVIKERGNELLDAEILFLCGKYLEIVDYNDDAKKLLAKSKSIFKKHSSKNNSIRKTVEFLANY